MNPRRALLSLPLLALARPSLAAPALARDALGGVLDGAASLDRLRCVIVARDGETLAERVHRGPGAGVAVNVKSVSKSVLSALVGAALERGALRGVEQTLPDLLGPAFPREAEARLRAVTLADLLSMRLGLEGTSGRNYGAWAASADPVRHALTRPPVEGSGGFMQYSTGTSHVLGAALARAAGRPLLALARDWLGAPLGVEVPPWPRDPQGRYLGGNDMRLSPRALLRLGEAYRTGGAPLFRGSWVRESWTPRALSTWSGQPYGYGWWLARVRGRDLAYAWGYGGQMLYVVPEAGITVVMTSDPDGPRDFGHTAALHALLAEGILPALGLRGPGGAPANPEAAAAG